MALLHVNEENYKKEVEDSEIPIILDFWAEWCPPCKMMGPVFEDLSKDYEGKLNFAKINTEESANIAIKFNIQSIPALIIIKKGKEIERIVGFAPKEELKKKIDNILSNLE